MTERGGQPHSTSFALSTDPQGNLFVYCDQKSCNWIKPVVRNATLYVVERMTAQHHH